MTNNLQVWHKEVIKSRFITSCLRTNLQRIDKLYGRLTRCSFELYKLRKEVDVEYISVSGVVTCKDEKTRPDFTEKKKDIELQIATLKKSVGDIVSAGGWENAKLAQKISKYEQCRLTYLWITYTVRICKKTKKYAIKEAGTLEVTKTKNTPSGILPQSYVGWRTKLSKLEGETTLSKPKRIQGMNNVT